MILLMPLATVLIIHAVPAPWETGNVFAAAALEPIAACVHDTLRDTAAPTAAARAAIPGLPGPI